MYYLSKSKKVPAGCIRNCNIRKEENLKIQCGFLGEYNCGRDGESGLREGSSWGQKECLGGFCTSPGKM